MEKPSHTATEETLQKRLALLAGQIPFPILLTDKSANIEYVNPAFSKKTGYSLSELLGHTPSMLKSGLTPRRVYEDLWHTILAGETWFGEIQNRNKQGHIYWESISVAPFLDERGEITGFIGVWHDITDQKFDERLLLTRLAQVEKQSRADPLTGIYNRRHILAELEKEMERSVRYGRKLAGLMLDLDGFKKINDTFGHLTGDVVLADVARTMEQTIRKVDICGRYGGDEFLILLPEATLANAKVAAERLQRAIAERSFKAQGKSVSVTASIGIFAPETFKDTQPIEFLDQIDQALLQAKKLGSEKIFSEPS